MSTIEISHSHRFDGCFEAHTAGCTCGYSPFNVGDTVALLTTSTEGLAAVGAVIAAVRMAHADADLDDAAALDELTVGACLPGLRTAVATLQGLK